MFRQDLSGSTSAGTTFSFTFDVTFRMCHRRDLRDLEWFGMFYAHRELIEQAFSRQIAGENLMLLAEANRFPIGQVWIDLAKKRSAGVGILWALRVLPPFQGRGLGTRLIAEGETLLRKHGFARAELGVEKNNPSAKKLYERMGYQVMGSHVEELTYLTPEGECVQTQSDEWILQKQLTPAVSEKTLRGVRLVPAKSDENISGLSLNS
jgi:GNAT superfamily N-acetyltransferase